MIFREALGAVQRFVASAEFEETNLPAEIRSAPDLLDSWTELAAYLGLLHDTLEALDKTSGERGGGLFEFYDRGLARIREHARSQASQE